MPSAVAYQFRIALRQISPKIWRRLQLLSSESLADLHYAIQAVMGWTDEYQHRFVIRNHCLGISRPGGLLLFGNPHDMHLERFEFRRGERFLYEYNFYDEWELDVRFEGASIPNPRGRYPFCLAGGHRAPAEDCGGPESFMDRWQRDPKQERAAHDYAAAAKLAALVRDNGLGPREFRDRARDILRRRLRPQFDRATANATLQRYARDGRLAVTGGEE